MADVGCGSDQRESVCQVQTFTLCPLNRGVITLMSFANHKSSCDHDHFSARFFRNCTALDKIMNGTELANVDKMVELSLFLL